MSKQHVWYGWVLVFSLALIAGCGDSPELRMQQAQIAMANGKPDQALKIVVTVLEEKPNDITAMQVKARAQMLLAHLSDSKKTLDALLDIAPEDIDSRQLLVSWTWFQIRNVLSQSDFSTNQDLQAKFEEAMSTGQAQSEWLASRDGYLAEARYFQARYANFDAARLRIMLQGEEKSLKSIDLDDSKQVGGNNSVVTARLKSQIEVRLNEATDYLVKSLEADPQYFKAAEMYAGMLVQRDRWSDLWIFANQMAETKELPASTAEQLVGAILAMPMTEQSKSRRLEVAQQIQLEVKQSHKESPTWKQASAKLHLVAGEWDKAKPLLDDVLKAQKGNIEARYLLAQSFYGLKEYDKAKAILENLSVKAPRSPQIQTLYGLVLMQTDQDSTMAKEALRRATDLNPNDTLAREAFLALMAQEGHIEQAQGDIDEYIKRNPADPRAIRFKLQFEQSQGRPQEVEALLARAETISPLTDEHLRVLVDGYMVLKKFDKAQKYARRLVNSRPDSLESHLKLAETMLMQGKDDQVKQMLVGLHEKFPEASNINQMLGRLYLQRQSYDRAVEMLEKVIEEEPNNATARVMLAQALASLSLVDEALEQLDEVLEQNPQDIRAHSLASRINQFIGRSEKANEHLAQIDESQINESSNPTLLAQIKLKKGDIEEASAICNRAVAAGNTDPVLRMLLAGIYIKKKDLGQAEIHLLALVRSQPNNRQAYALLTRFYVEQKMGNKGLTEMEKLQVVNEPMARLSQASILRAAGKRNEAMDRLEPIYEPLIRKRSPMAMMIANAMARMHAEQGDRTAASAVYEPIIEADLNAANARLQQINLTASSDQIQQTVEKLDALAATLTPEQKRLKYQVMKRFVSLGRVDRALEMLDEWIVQAPGQPTLLRWKGELLVQVDRPDEAVGALEQAVAIAPDSVVVRLKLAQAHASNFDYPSAEKVLQEAKNIDTGSKIVSLASLGRLYLGIGLNRQAAQAFEELERAGRPSDPRVLLAMGQAYSALRQDDLARQRLDDVPEYASQYASSQFLLSRIEQRLGLADEAKKRLMALARNRNTATIAMKELVALKVRNRSVQDMIQWSDQSLNLDTLPPALRVRWMQVRIVLAADEKNWDAVLSQLEEMSKHHPVTEAPSADSLTLVASRIVVMHHLGKKEQAKQLFRLTPQLASTVIGPLLAVGLGEPSADVSNQAPIPLFIQAMAHGDLDAARSAAEKLQPLKTVFRTDLLSVLDRPDAQSDSMAKAFALLAMAQVAQEACGLPQLAVEMCEQVIRSQPGIAVAHSLLAQAMIQLKKSTDNALAIARRALPGSALVLLLSASDKSVNHDFDGAAADLRQLLEREPGNYYTSYNLAQALQRAGRIDDAIGVLEQVTKTPNPFMLVASNDLAYLLAENHPSRLDEAYTLADQAFQKAPAMTPLLDTIGWIEHLRGNNEKALAHLNRAVVGLREVSEVHYHLGAIYKAVNNATWARYHLEEAASGSKEKPETSKARKMLDGLAK